VEEKTKKHLVTAGLLAAAYGVWRLKKGHDESLLYPTINGVDFFNAYQTAPDQAALKAEVLAGVGRGSWNRAALISRPLTAANFDSTLSDIRIWRTFLAKVAFMNPNRPSK
jgi:hypothetical protein